MVDTSKRQFLKQGMCGFSVYGVGAVWANALLGGRRRSKSSVLRPADENGVRLPAGYSSRIIAHSGHAVISGRDFSWHAAPDGGACFAANNGGWIYVCNAGTECNNTSGCRTSTRTNPNFLILCRMYKVLYN